VAKGSWAGTVKREKKRGGLTQCLGRNEENELGLKKFSLKISIDVVQIKEF
jgi:hypothetical protein